AAELHRLFRVELRRALRTVGRAAVQVVELRLAVRTDLLGAEGGISQGAHLLSGMGGRTRKRRLPCHLSGALSKALRRRAGAGGPGKRTRVDLVTGPEQLPQHLPERLIASASGALNGRVRAPGDKSISHRAMILGGL